MRPGFYWVSAPAKYRTIEERSINVGHPMENQPAFFDGEKWWFIGGLITFSASLFKRLDCKVLGLIEERDGARPAKSNRANGGGRNTKDARP